VNIPLTGVPLREELGRSFGVPVYVDNDANCAALAEAHMVGVSHLVMLTLGTGVGGGVVIDGMTFRGAHGLGAELGHIAVNSDGPPCPGNCPNRGCLEAYCSGQALERDGTSSPATSPTALSRAARAGREAVRPQARGGGRGRRPDALLIMDNFGRMLGIGIANYVNVFEPTRLAIGGGLSRASHLFLRPRHPGGGRPDASRAVEAGNGRSCRGRRGRRRHRRGLLAASKWSASAILT
jgi:glucokinase